MSLLEFILSFVLLSLVGSAAIYGWWLSTRGDWEITPDGKWKKTGMIFKYWSLFFEQYRSSKTVHYQGMGLAKKFELLKKVHPAIASKMQYDLSRIWAHSGHVLTDKEIKLIEDTCLCYVSVDHDGSLILFTDEPVYDFPEWIQKPLSSCPTCLAGPYGTALWLFFLKVEKGAFLWTDSPIFCKTIFGIIFLLTLSCLLTSIHKLLKF